MPDGSAEHHHPEDHDHENEGIDIDAQLAQMQSDFENQLQEDEALLRLVTELAAGKKKWKKLLKERITVLDDILAWNRESLDPLLEMYEMYLADPSDETMMQFSVLESRRLLMRDFFLVKTLLARIGSDVENINQRLAKIEKHLEPK